MKRIIFFSLVLLGCLAQPALASVTNVKAEHRKGQTFLTFKESSPTATYAVYRSDGPITGLSGRKPIAQLSADSGKYLFTGKGFVICDLCPPLSDDTGLLVWTTAETGTFYYSVQVTGESAFAITGPIVETHQDVPGVVLTDDWVSYAGNKYRTYFAWEDYSTWGHGEWGYYGNKFGLTWSGRIDPVVEGSQYPLFLYLHSAVSGVYLEPPNVSDTTHYQGFIVSPADMCLSGVGTANGIYHNQQCSSQWSGYPVVGDAAQARLATANRVVRYMRAIAAVPEFQIDPNRLYIFGSSMGGVGMHIAYDAANAGIFAAVSAGSGMPSFQRFSGCGGPYGPANDPVLLENGQKQWAEWFNVKVSVTQARALPPVTYRWGTNDTHPTCIFTEAIQSSESAKQAVWAEWILNGGHAGGDVYIGADTTPLFERFKLNEAYPAFSSVSLNDNVADMSKGGQHNIKIDWQSALHAYPGGSEIADTPTAFAISLKSLAGNATATVTIRNAQQFQPPPGQNVTWRNESQGQVLQSGSVVADDQGRVTVALQIVPAGNRLTLSCTTCVAVAAKARGAAVVAPKAPAPPRNVRVVRP